MAAESQFHRDRSYDQSKVLQLKYQEKAWRGVQGISTATTFAIGMADNTLQQAVLSMETSGQRTLILIPALARSVVNT